MTFIYGWGQAYESLPLPEVLRAVNGWGKGESLLSGYSHYWLLMTHGSSPSSTQWVTHTKPTTQQINKKDMKIGMVLVGNKEELGS